MTVLIAECETVVDAYQPDDSPLAAQHHHDEFLATLGHEMRNPLSALSYALQVWGWAKSDPEQMEEIRQVIEREVGQLTRLSEDLLDAARIVQGKLAFRREPIDLRQILDHACQEIRPFINRRGHSLSMEIPNDKIPVFGDGSRLLQAFANLIQNAAKFTASRGSLHVAVELQAGNALVRIRDNGQGIEEQMLSRIFEAFTQVGGAHSLATDGLGIGLRLVKTIVEIHGGTIAVRSQGLGCGSEFFVQLPLMSEAAPVEHNGHN